MRHAVRSFALLVLVTVLVGAGGGAARGDEPVGDAAVAVQRLRLLQLRVEALLRTGEALARAGRLEEALAAFRDAERIAREGLEPTARPVAKPAPAPAAPVPGRDAPFEAGVDPADLHRGLLEIGGSARPFRARGGMPEAPPWARDAVDDALRWLHAHQSPNGGWEAAGFNRWRDGKPVADLGSMPDGLGKAVHDVGVTGLATCAFLAAGYTNRGKHPFAQTVSKALRHLKNVQDPDGCFGPRAAQTYIYNHLLASLAVVEAYGMTGSPILKGSAQRALDFTFAARNPYFAWRYGIKPGDNDTSVTSWAALVLHAADRINAGARSTGRPLPLRVDELAWHGITNWLDKVTDPDTGHVGYLRRGDGPARVQEMVDRFPSSKSEACTAAGLAMRILSGVDPRTSDVLQKGAARCLRLVPAWNPADGRIDMYYWHFGTVALYQVGGEAWKAWAEALRPAVGATQRQDTEFGRYKGSWDPIGPWGVEGGRVYSTAVLALTLAAWGRYERVFPDGD